MTATTIDGSPFEARLARGSTAGEARPVSRLASVERAKLARGEDEVEAGDSAGPVDVAVERESGRVALGDARALDEDRGLAVEAAGRRPGRVREPFVDA